MIDSIALENFQNHKYSELSFVPGVNVIVGPSDSGKTAIFRALTWLSTNRPAGETFRSNWGGDTSVEVRVSGHELIRRRTKTLNEYEVDGKVEKAVGSSVPQSVSAILHLDPSNWQHQHAGPYLLDNTPGDVARQLNAAASLDKIDTAQKHITQRTREAARRCIDIEAHREEVKGKLEEAEDHLEDIQSLARRAEKVCTSHETVVGKLRALETVCKDIREVARQGKKIEKELQHEQALLKVETVWREYEAVQLELGILTALLAEMQRKAAGIRDAETMLKDFEEQWHEDMPDICPLCGRKG